MYMSIIYLSFGDSLAVRHDIYLVKSMRFNKLGFIYSVEHI